MLVVHPESGDIIDVNPAAVSYYGYSHEEFRTKKITDINMLTKEQVLSRPVCTFRSALKLHQPVKAFLLVIPGFPIIHASKVPVDDFHFNPLI